MARRPEVSLGLAAGTGAIVLALHQNATPPIADVRTSSPGTADHNDVNKARRQTTWIAGGVVGGISLLARDPTIAVVGWTFAILADWWYRHANEVNPALGRIVRGEEAGAVVAEHEARAAQTDIQPPPYAGIAAVM